MKKIFAVFEIIVLTAILAQSVGAIEPGTAEFDAARMLIAKVIESYAPEEAYNCRVGIGAVIVNRSASKYHPQSIYDVIYEYGAFPAVNSYEFANLTPTPRSMRAARDALLGLDCTGGALRFFKKNDTVMAEKYKHDVTIEIGKIVFAK